MPQIRRDCPHCHTKSTAFIGFGEVRHVREKQIYTVGFYCAGCYAGMMAEVRSDLSSGPMALNGDLDAAQHVNVRTTYPVAAQTQAPGHLPSNVESFYLQAAVSLQAKNYDAAAMMARKALESATKHIFPAGTGSLYTRIEELAKQGKITPQLQEWAHAIRLDGNTAAHDTEPVTQEFAKELLSYSEMFLMYTITMPAMIENRRPDVGANATS